MNYCTKTPFNMNYCTKTPFNMNTVSFGSSGFDSSLSKTALALTKTFYEYAKIFAIMHINMNKKY